MPNGRPGDHPITDILQYGASPFPEDMVKMIVRMHKKSAKLTDRITVKELIDWERGERLDQGRKKLRDICRKHGIPVPRRRKA